MSYRHTNNFELQKKTTRDGVEICLPQLHCRAKYLPALGWPTKKQGVGAMTFANRSWYLSWLKLSTRIRNSIKKRRGKKITDDGGHINCWDDYSFFVRINQKGHGERRRKGAGLFTLSPNHDHEKVACLYATHHSNNNLSLLASNFLDGGFLFFIIKGSYYQLSGRYSSFVTFFFMFDSLHHDAKKSLRLLLFFLGLLFFYASHTISISHLYICISLFFFLVGEADGLD